MNRQEHCRETERLLGDRFEDVHRWLDGTACVDGKLNIYHRRNRHHTEGVEEVRKMWGDDAAEAAIIHIKQDEGYVPTREQAERMYPSKPFLVAFDRLDK